MWTPAAVCKGPGGQLWFLPGPLWEAGHFSEREGGMWEVAYPRRGESLTPEQPD